MDATTETTTPHPAGGALQGGPLLAAISNEIVGVYRGCDRALTAAPGAWRRPPA